MKWWTPRMARGLRRSYLPTVVEKFSVCRRREGGKSSVNCPKCWIGVSLYSAYTRFPTLFRMWTYPIVVGPLVRHKRKTLPETWRTYFLLNIKFSEAAWWCSPSTCITCVALNLSGAGRRRWCDSINHISIKQARAYTQGDYYYSDTFSASKPNAERNENKNTVECHSLLHFHCRRTRSSVHAEMTSL